MVAVALDGKVYVIGGLTPGGGTTDRVEAYDPGTDSWDEKAPLPKALHHSGATALGGKIYVAGGFVKTGFAPVADVFVYDPSADSWSAGPPMPTARGALAAAAVDGLVYTVGGVTGFGLARIHRSDGPWR